MGHSITPIPDTMSEEHANGTPPISLVTFDGERQVKGPLAGWWENND